ncbi:uncharacterized protein G2W53_039532 [Senna tora]|uniref:Uncharacterized protein n=1 Tax=Senna tora TaxID=362788 RepID=A0A834SQ59_9FABA|nr:uncharacterized protein G2W53_039532 [Senna tora]
MYNAKRYFKFTCATTHLNLYFLSSFDIQSRFSIRNVFRHDLTHLPRDHEPHSSIKSTQIPKYNAKRSVLLTCATIRHDMTHLECDHEPNLRIKFTRISKYNAKRSEPHSSIKSTRIPKYNAKRSI